MADSLIQIGKAQAHYNVSNTRILKYSLEMYHNGLTEHRIISAPDLTMLENKANLQAQKWTEKWDIISTKRKNADEREANFEEANERSGEAKRALEEIDNLLTHTLFIDDTVNWDSLKKKSKFPENCPDKPEKKSYNDYPIKPDRESSEFVPTFTFLEKLISSKKEKKIQDYENKF